MSEASQGPVELDETRRTRPMPKGLLLGSLALLGLMVVLAPFVLSSGSQSGTPEVPALVDDAGTLAGGVVTETEQGRAPSDTGPEVPPNTVPVGLADPEPGPAAPWVDEQNRLEARLASVEQAVERLRQRQAVVAADLDTLVAGEPWAQAEAARGADPAALQAVEDQAERLQSLEGRLGRLEAAQRTRAAAAAPPFELVAIDWWNGEPYATLHSQGRYTRIQEGESVSGWALDRIDATRREAAFRQADRVVRLTAQGG